MPITNLVIDKDQNGTATYFTEVCAPSYKYSARLQAGVPLTLAVPSNAVRAMISGSDFFAVSTEGVITMPVEGNGFGLTTGELNKATIVLKTATNLYFIARQDTDVYVAFFG
jgi:hypothetical protein